MVTTVATAAMTVMAATGATAAPTAAAAVPAPVFCWLAPHRRRGMRSIGARANTFSELPLPHIPRYLTKLQDLSVSFPHSTLQRFSSRLYQLRWPTISVLENVPNFDRN